MGIYYFLNHDAPRCYTVEYFRDYMKENNLETLKILEARQLKGSDFFYCRYFQSPGERGQNCCKNCKKYVPRNSKKGICLHYGQCYEATDNFRILKLSKTNPYSLKIDNISILPSDIKALTWKQPFAELMLYGKIETRTWKTKYRGWVLICSAQKSYNAEQLGSICGLKQICRISNRLQPYPKPEGKAIAIAKLTDCRPMTINDEDKCFVTYCEGLYCHIYENIIPIEPFNFKGKQGFSNITEEILKQIKCISIKKE